GSPRSRRRAGERAAALVLLAVALGRHADRETARRGPARPRRRAPLRAVLARAPRNDDRSADRIVDDTDRGTVVPCDQLSRQHAARRASRDDAPAVEE